MRTLDLYRFPVACAYTIDSCELGEIVAETFNAASATVRITGVSAHPMSAKGVLVNPILVALDLVACLDREQTPECTEGREGFVWVNHLTGTQAGAEIGIAIRDHDRAGYEARSRPSSTPPRPRARCVRENAPVRGGNTQPRRGGHC